ncbi:MAG: L-serine ammonia-lyase, iron-sulfur-dependent, subunit alpha [Deltaproteobacteria bacterium]|jgi:L-cysteine desulfidase|nr:L-serine ammonia-lyase, iron-sulfur-dependent, subunit alpha [Deltaproteobacteria bacterium]
MSTQASNSEWPTFISIINREVVPALGCTEPIVIALAAARAARELGMPPESVEVSLSGNLLKNGMGVGVPGTGETGLDIAAAVGALAGVEGKDSLGLEVLRDLTPEQAAIGHKMVRKGKTSISLVDTPELLYAAVTVRAEGHFARAAIKGTHTNIVLVEKDGRIIFSQDQAAGTTGQAAQAADGDGWPLTMQKIHEFATTAPLEMISFILKTAEMTTPVAEEGLRNKYGLQVGRSIDESIGKKILSDDIVSYAMKMTAAAADVRMSGAPFPVMSNSGSGNQGITCTMPVVAFARRLGSSQEELTRALIMSHLTSIHIKHHLGRLSAHCGAPVAATASGCGIVLLLGGGLPQISNTVKNMVGNLVGMICDGAKTSCALKVATSVNAAIQAVFLGMNGIAVPGRDGIVAEDLEQNLKNLGRLAKEGMPQADKIILDIMIKQAN